jgi:hypothetical protein
VAGYDVYRDGAKVATTTTTSFLDEGLAPASQHAYVVRAADAAGNVSSPSATVNVKTASLATSRTGTAAGAVFDAASGLPLANVVVSTTVGSTVKQQKTNGSGVYKLSSLPPAGYVLSLALGSRSGQVTTTVVAGETVLARPLL